MKLVEILRRNSNFLYLADPAPVVVNNVVYWIAEPVVCVGDQVRLVRRYEHYTHVHTL